MLQQEDWVINLKWKKNKSLRFHVALWFFLVIGVLLLAIWIFQLLLITPYYERRSKDNLRNEGNRYYNAYILDNSKFNDISRDAMMENMHITIGEVVTNEFGEEHFEVKETEMMGGMFIIEFNDRELLEKIDSGKTIYADDRSDMYFYVRSIEDNTYFVVSTRITPINATKMIIKEQLIIITVFAIVIGLVATYIASKSISEPLAILTDQAYLLGKGNYDIDFAGDGYREVSDLASTLNKAEKKIKASDEYRRSITANVSHDLKTPLTIIKSYAEMIKDLYKDNETKRNESLDVIINEADRLAMLVNDVLMLSKLESGTISLELSEVNLSSLLKQCLLSFDIMQEKDGYIINTDIDDDLIVDADEKKMNAIFYNLIGNAINYCGDDKTIYVSLKKENNYAKFNVRNYGGIIDIDKQEKIWDEYYRDENSHKRNSVGTGLGLSIVKNVFELHKLDYGVISNLEDGTNFFFKIKLK